VTHQLPPTHRSALRRLGPWLAAVALAAACSSGPNPSLSLTPDTTAPTAIRGSDVQVAIDLTRVGTISEPVALAITGLPTHVTASFAPPTLSGSDVEATLTLSVAAAAAEGTAGLTITATAGSVTADAELTLTVASLTISGRAEAPLRQPLVGATVASQGQSTYTDAYGEFTLSGLALPYDLVVAAPVGDGGIHVFEGLTTPTPTLRPTFAFLTFGGPSFGAGVSGNFAGGALAANERVVVCLEGLAVAVLGCDRAGGGESTYGLGANWFAGANVPVRLHALHLAVDGDDVPTAYLGYETIDLNLADGGATLADLAFEPVAIADLTGSTSQAAGYTDTDLVVLARFGPNLSMAIGGLENPGAAFAYLVPVLPGLSYDVVFVGTRPGDTVFTVRHDVGLDAGALAIQAPANPIVPADGAVGVDLTTTFASSGVGGARTYLWNPDAVGPLIALTTTRTSVTIPDPALGGLVVPAGALYEWLVLGQGDDDPDTAAAGGYLDYMTIVYGVSFGGPGLDGDRTLALPTVDRAFTFAP
jgi:hypothetical protein